MGTQEGYIIVTAGHMSRCQICGTRTSLTKEIFRSGKWETLSMCYDCQVNNEEAYLLKHLPRDLRTRFSAVKQDSLEKWITTH